MEVHYGEAEWIVKEGDCLYFDANVPPVGIRIDDRSLKPFMASSPDSNGDLPRENGKGRKRGIDFERFFDHSEKG